MRKDIKNALNPCASSFRTAPSHKSLAGLRVNQYPLTAPAHHVSRYRPHPRAEIDSDTFEPQTSAQLQSPAVVVSSLHTQIQNDSSQHLGKSLNASSPRLHDTPTQSLTSECSCSNTHDFLMPSGELTCSSREYSVIQPGDLADDGGPGREALAMEPSWAQAILSSFVQKYALTGTPCLGLAAIQLNERNAEIQQRLEYIIMQKKEMAALATHLFSSGYLPDHIRNGGIRHSNPDWPTT